MRLLLRNWITLWDENSLLLPQRLDSKGLLNVLVDVVFTEVLNVDNGTVPLSVNHVRIPWLYKVDGM